MALKDKAIPNEIVYLKLRDYPDGEELTVVSAGVNDGAKYGPMPYFILDNGERVALPTRYSDYISSIIESKEDMEEMSKGMVLIKSSRATQSGGTTPTFTWA